MTEPDHNPSPAIVAALQAVENNMEGLNQLAAACYTIAREMGWWEQHDRNLGELITLMHTELSEAFEEHRAGNAVDLVYYGTNGKPEGVPVELADCIIRIMDIFGHHQLNLGAVLHEKLKYNTTRGYRHGGKLA